MLSMIIWGLCNSKWYLFSIFDIFVSVLQELFIIFIIKKKKNTLWPEFVAFPSLDIVSLRTERQP